MQLKTGGIIILDGPDGAGKTTLARAIMKQAEKIGYEPIYKHLSKPIDAWGEHRDALLEYINAAHSPSGRPVLIVADRHFISEAVYGHVYRQGSEYPYAARHVDRLLHRFGALRVVCAPPVDYVTSTHEKLKQTREEMYDKGMDLVARMYHDLWHGSSDASADYSPMGDYVQQLIFEGGVADKCGWYHYDVTTDGKDMPAYCDELLSELKAQTGLVSMFNDASMKNLTGWPRKQSVLLVGDKISDQDSLGVPFLSNSNSSLYLAKTLQKIHADESRVCMVNINDPLGEAAVRSAAHYCGRIVVMGRMAEQGMEIAKVKYDARVRHPQHASRFSHRDNTYAHELREAFSGMAGTY